MLRALFRPLARKAVQLPIETIVFFFVIATLAHFHLLEAIRHSTFLQPAGAPLRPAFARSHDGVWSPASEADWQEARAEPAPGVRALELQQLVFNGAHSIENVTRYITRDVPALSGKPYTALCHPTASGKCFTLATAPTTRPPILTLAFGAGMRDGFVNALKRKGKFSDAGVTMEVESRRPQTFAEMKSGMWVAYAARAVVLRFWDLAKVRLSQTCLYMRSN